MNRVAETVAPRAIAARSPTLTVIVPVYNEADTIGEILQRVLDAPYDKQIIAVNDGSTDETGMILDFFEARGDISVVTHAQNRGKGRAIRSALAHALGTWTLIQDGDLEHQPSDYSLLVEPLLNDTADFAIGWRVRERKTTSGLAFYRWGVTALNVCVRLLYGVAIKDEACCYKILPTKTLRAMDLECERFEFCPEVVAKACRLKLRIHQAPIAYHPRTVAAGKKIRYSDGLAALRTLWRFRRWTPTRVA